MTVLLNRAYNGMPQGSTVELTAEVETALIAQGLASSALLSTLTTGAQTSTTYGGTVAVAIGAASVVVNNSLITANSKVFAVVSQAAADATALRVERIVPAAGLATIYVTAAATAATFVDWALLPTVGATPAQ